MVARRLAGATRGSMLTLIALVAIVSGFVQFGVAAARRTENSYDRFVAWAQPATLSTGGGPEELGNLGDLLPRVNSLPGIDDWGRFDGVSAGWIELTPGRRTYAPRLNVNAVVTKPSDPTHGRLKLIAGTIPKDDSIHATDTAAARLHRTARTSSRSRPPDP